MTLVEFLSQPLFHRLGLTLVHFLWQGLAVAFLIGNLVRLFRIKHGNGRYLTYLLAFTAMIACPVITFTAIDIPLSQPSEIVAIAQPDEILDSISYDAESEVYILPETDISSPTIPGPVTVTNSTPLGERISTWLNILMPSILLIWITGVIALSIRLLAGFIGVHRWHRNLQPLPDKLNLRIASLCNQLGMQDFSRVFISPTILQAMAVGYIKPMVLLPVSMVTQMNPEMLEAVIAHELAHIRRFDLWINLAQRITETLLFYHPAVWWMSNCLRIERELCCDELAVKVTGRRLTYAKTLQNVSRTRFTPKQPYLATGLGQDKKPTLTRIRHILGLKPAQQNSPFWLAGVIAVLFLAALTIPTTLALTNNADKKSSKSENVTTELIRTYKLDKRVSDFPPTADFSTPQAAYATIMRDYMATGASGAEWSKISATKRMKFPASTVPPKKAESYRNARIVEVQIYKERIARVFAEMKEDGKTGYDQRSLVLHKGQWLNSGHDGVAQTLKKARKTFARKSEKIYQSSLEKLGEAIPGRWNRPPVSDPKAHLKPYLDFLKKQGSDPHTFMMNAFKKYELVTMGEVHNRPDYWAFNIELVKDPAFAQSVGTIYLELPLNHQENIDRFLSQPTCEKEIVIDMLRDFFELGWPCDPTLDFFVAVWQVNQKLPPGKQLRMRLVDMQRPWDKINERKDWQQYNVDRDLFMAQNILKDRKTRRVSQRNGFFIVGMGHAMEGLYYADKATCRETAGYHLKQALGNQLFTVFQHVPVMTNHGKVSGRLALGLIDTAFARLNDKPIAFTLQSGPFGKLPFDGMPDSDVYGDFRDGYDAYVYLLPLEHEKFSQLIEGFYSEKHMPEIDRRYKIMNGKPLRKAIATPEGMTAMRAAFWGQPRSWIGWLGPEDAWHHGDQWQTIIEKEHHANIRREQLTTELDKIYNAIRKLDPGQHWQAWEKEFGFNYLTMRGWDTMYIWWCDVTKEHPLESVQYGELTRNKKGLPQIKVTTTLAGGITFSKDFTFKYNALRDSWQSQYGLDLHLDKKWKSLPGKIKETEND